MYKVYCTLNSGHKFKNKVKNSEKLPEPEGNVSPDFWGSPFFLLPCQCSATGSG